MQSIKGNEINKILKCEDKIKPAEVDSKTFNDLAHEVLALREENEKLKAEKSKYERAVIKTGMILQSYGEEKEKGCEYCNPNHPEYNDVYGIQTTAKGVHYITLIAKYNTDTEKYETIDLEIDYCPVCDRKLDKREVI